jgi:hypothetical protein
MKRLVLLLMIIAQAACVGSTAADKALRAPLLKSDVKITSPQKYEQRATSVDSRTNQPAYYDPKPRVEVVDAKAGKYALKWIGYDGQEKVIEYQRPDVIDAIVAATVTKDATGKYLYSYKIENLPTSPTNLSGFTLQTFAADAEPVKIKGIFNGRMTNAIRQFSVGTWLDFGIMSTYPSVIGPGQSIELRLVSSAPPGLVECRVTAGTLTLKGAGEHMPSELEDSLPGYEILPRGHTIAPMDDLKNLSVAERARYVLSVLPEFQKLGWMTEGKRNWYEQKLKSNDFATLSKQLEQDLRDEQITSEVFGTMQILLS